MKILYAASEALPFVASGGLADVAGSLPKALQKEGAECRVVLPLYSGIKDSLRAQLQYVTHFNVPLSWRNQYCGLFTAQVDGVTYYLLDNEYYFKRGGIYGFYDDAERFVFFSKAVLEMLTVMDYEPDIISCNDWQTAMVPVFLNVFYRGIEKFRRIRTVFTIHNIQYQGKYGMEIATDICGLPDYAVNMVTYDGTVNMMKGAIEQCDMISTVSPSYANELCASEASGHLAQVISAHKLVGIRNGIHGEINPFDCPYVHRPYDGESVHERVFNKLWMQENMSLRLGEDIPVLGCVSRLLPRKGFELLVEVLPEFLKNGAELVVCGNGKRDVKEALQQLEAQFPEQVAVISYSEKSAAEVLSSIDLFLMPSLIEPCGTAQLQAMRYGAVPLVRATGGLKDTVKPYDTEHPEGWGFVFDEYTPEALKTALTSALEVYRDTAAWETLEKRCMAQDFSWEQPARDYVRLYEGLLNA